ncbi:MAG: UvrY/SirA/GacA family response regulator transcription factor [Gammaproteobacteria bacterium]|nr:UvrY/SirA/GacA family response regulator transcription factor [Gammaproteobacteria bacterium]
MIKVLIVDDHELVRMGVRLLLDNCEDIDVVAEAENGDAALKKAKACNPDVVLLDMKMPGMDGWEVTRRLKQIKPNIHIIVLTAATTTPLPTRLLQLGAMGYLTKDSAAEEMLQAIQKVSRGERYLSAEIAQKIALDSLNPTEISPLECLSEREMQVMFMITRGLTVNQIAEKLFLSPKTVGTYRYRMFEKLGIKNDVELTHLAMKHGAFEQNLNESEDVTS